MEVEDAKRLKELESESARLKRLLAEAHLDIEVLEMLRQAFAGCTVYWGAVEERVRQSPFRILKNPLKKAAATAGSVVVMESLTRAIGPTTMFTID